MGPTGKTSPRISFKERKQFFGMWPVAYTWAEAMPGTFLACVFSQFFAAGVGVGKHSLSVTRGVTFRKPFKFQSRTEK